jgi:flagellar FliL protein
MAEEDDIDVSEGSSGEKIERVATKPKKNRTMLIIFAALAVVGIVVAVGVVFFMGEKNPEDTSVGSKTAPLVIKDIPEFNLSLLSDDPSSQHFIKMKVALELSKAADVYAVDEALPRLQDDWGGFLRQMRMSDLQGSANLQRLKEGLLRRANQSLAPIEVRAVYVRELLIQ